MVRKETSPKRLQYRYILSDLIKFIIFKGLVHVLH